MAGNPQQRLPITAGPKLRLSADNAIEWRFINISCISQYISGRDKGRMRIRMRMADTDADEKIRMRKCGWGIKRGWENADGG